MKNLIKKILKEESLKQNLKQQIKDYGWKSASELVNGIDELFSIMNFESPMDFLHLFDDMKVVQSEKKPNWTLFRFEPKNNLMVYDRKKDEVYINYGEIWSVLQSHFSLSYFETKRLTQKWLDDAYNLKGVKTLQLAKASERGWTMSIT
jgi:hypothetical protein